MKKLIFVFLTLFFAVQSYGQQNEIYRNEGKSFGHSGASYNVDILILQNDGGYELIYQKFYSKKMKNKNVFYDLSTEKGKWNKKEGVLYLENTNSKNKMKFIIINNNKIAPLIEGVEVSPIKWKKVN